jgi:hypothetical protein
MICVFIIIARVSPHERKNFFDDSIGTTWYKKDMVIPPNKITEPITALFSACYRLCVFASGSLIMFV